MAAGGRIQPATVIANEPAGTLLRRLSLDLVPADHVRVGQYAAVHRGETRGTFAFASSPGEPVLLLVKDDGAIGTAIASTPAGEVLQVGPARGGFPMEQVADRELVLLVNGSGISAARPVVREEIARGMPRPVHLLYGVFTPDHAAFASESHDWRRAGVDVQLVLGAPGPEWRGPTGFVQEVARDLGLVRPDVGVLLVGLPVMIEHARSLWLGAGTPASQIIVNF